MKKEIEKNGDIIFFNKNYKMSKRNFIKKFKVKRRTYFYDLYSRLYDFIIGGSTNLYKEYRKYYKKEYKNYNKFLMERFNMNDDLLKKFNNKKSYYKKEHIQCDQAVHNLAQDDEIRKIISEFMGGYEYGY